MTNLKKVYLSEGHFVKFCDTTTSFGEKSTEYRKTPYPEYSQKLFPTQKYMA
jgi:hypothetical protein